MLTVELHFPILGQSLPASPGYDLYGSLCRRVPRLHEADCSWQVGPVAGIPGGNGTMQLESQRSRLRLRLPDTDIREALPLAGRELDVGGHHVRLGVPQVRALEPAPTLAAKLVVIKVHEHPNPTPEDFLTAVRKKLADDGIQGEAAIPLVRSGLHAGKPRRGVLWIKGKRLIGYSMIVQGLSVAESLTLLEKGLGGKRKMGCGWFVAVRPEA
jgi:CRISPR-associated protein Cas6